MNFFTVIPEGQAIVHARGVYRQVPIYERGGHVYARFGGGMVRLNMGGATSAPNVRWAEAWAPAGQIVEKPGGFVEWHPAPTPVAEAAE